MVPEGWERRSLGDLLEFKNGFNTEKANYGQGTPFINVSEVLKHESLTADLIPGQVSVTEKELSANSVVHGDILFNRTSETTDEVGFTAVYLDTVPVIFGGFVIRGRPTNGSLHPEFTKYALRQPSVRSEIIRRSQGAVRSNIGQGELSKVEVALPPLPEQRKIADILSTWDAAIEKTEALLATAKAQKRALMQSLLTGKRRFPEFEGQPWKEVKASEVFETVSIKRNEHEPLLAVTQDQGVLRRDDLDRRVVMPDGNTAGYKLVVPGNFIISLRSFQGGLEYSAVRGLVSPAYHVLQPTREIDDAFYKHYFKSYDFIGHLAVAIIGIRDGKQISYSDFSFLKIPLPSLAEQRLIGQVMEVQATEIEVLDKRVAKLRTEKKALMQQLLTGKRRVSV